MSDQALDESLASQADAWLVSESRWRPRPLPAALQSAFERDTRRARSRASGLVGIMGSLVAVGIFPVLAAAAPNVHAEIIRFYIEFSVPVTLGASLLASCDPKPALRELLLTIPSVVMPVVLTCLFTWSQARSPSQPLTELYLTCMTLIMLFATVTVQLRFTAAVAVAAIALGLFMIGVQAAPGDTGVYRSALDVTGATCAIYMLLANWRINQEQLHTYVLTLRERLRREALSLENRALDELARRDALTGLANRRAYDAWLHTTCLQARDTGGHIGLIMLDVDHFKKYNDFYGHPTGDACLGKVAACLREQLRGTSDQVARVGGEEFAVILPGSTAQTCMRIAGRLREAVAALELPHLGHGRNEIVTVSCGCASLQAAATLVPQDLSAAADAALYLAKESGRNRVCVPDVLAAESKEVFLF